MSANAQITDKTALIRAFWPHAREERPGVFRVGDVWDGEGSSAVAFAESGRFYDHNGGESLDLVGVVAHRLGCDDTYAVRALRAQGWLSDTDGPVTPPAPTGIQEPHAFDYLGPYATVQHCAVIAAPVTLADIDRAPVWAPAAGKKVVGPWRHSTPEGVTLARFGGEYHGKYGILVLLPWGTRDDIAGQIQQRRMNGCVPSLCLSGDAGCPSPLDILVLDLDVKEGTTPAAIRDRLMAPLLEAGVAPFASTSGRGRHVVMRLDPKDLGREHYRRLPPEGPRKGVCLEIFPAGTRRHIVWHRDRQLAGPGPGPDDPLPRVSLSLIIQAAQAAFEVQA